MAQHTLKCWNCGAEISYVDRLPLRAECDKCRSDAHVCKNCTFYDPKVYHECREPQAEYVQDKERSNICDYFQPSTGSGGKGPTKEDLLKAAEALFKKK